MKKYFVIVSLLLFSFVLFTGCIQSKQVTVPTNVELAEIAKNNPEVQAIISEKENLNFKSELVCDPIFEISVKIDPLFDPAIGSYPASCEESEKNWAVYAVWVDKGVPSGVGAVIDAQTLQVLQVLQPFGD